VHLGGQIGGEMGCPASDVSPDQYLREQERRISKNQQKPSSQKAGDAFQVVQIDSSRAIDILVDRKLRRLRIGIEWTFPGIFGTAKSTTNLHHPRYRHPWLEHQFQNHDAGDQYVRMEYRILEAQHCGIE
jgi:hypothetical protein